jgi:hypothetical protein
MSREYQLVGGPLDGQIVEYTIPRDDLYIKIKHHDENRYALYSMGINNYEYTKTVKAADLPANDQAEMRFAECSRTESPKNWQGQGWTIWSLK